MGRKPVIGVMGGGSVDAEVMTAAEELGSLIARRGWILLNGGRDCGVMKASAAGAKRAGGFVVGVLPDRDARGATSDLDVAIVTGLGDGRNLVNVLSSDVVIAMAGGVGTLSEIALALKNEKPVILLGWDGWGGSDIGRSIGSPIIVSRPVEAVARAATLLVERGIGDV